MRTEKIKCKVCKKGFNVYAKKSKNGAVSIFGRLVNPSHLPKHSCKGAKDEWILH